MLGGGKAPGGAPISAGNRWNLVTAGFFLGLLIVAIWLLASENISWVWGGFWVIVLALSCSGYLWAYISNKKQEQAKKTIATESEADNVFGEILKEEN